MKRIIHLTLLLLLGVLPVQAQNQERTAPRTPQGAKAASPAAPVTQAGSIGDGPEVTIVDPLKGIVIVDKARTINRAGARGISGLLVKGPAFLIDTSFAGVVAPYLGTKLTNKKLAALQGDIIRFCRKKDHPVIDVMFEEQEIVDGVIQVTVIVGKVGRVDLKNEGDQFFKSSVISQQFRLRAGDDILESTLIEDINWINRNPFRTVDVKLKPGEVGKVDIDVEVKDRLPLRAYMGFEDSLTRLLESRMWYVGFNWGNAFQLDHQFNYQFSASTDFNRLNSHSLSYVIPLKWRHTLTFYGSRTEVEPNMAILGFPALTQQGESWQGSVRYGIPIPRLFGRVDSEVSLGFDYKASDNNLEFGGTNVFNRPTDIGQFSVGYRLSIPDANGATMIGGTFVKSPGGLFSRNNDKSFILTRPGATASYYYARVEGERNTKLPWGFTWVLKATAQLTDDTLLPSEQIGVGGFSTVRGYEERTANGDHGWVVNNELRTPAWQISNFTGNPETGDKLQFLAFFDAGSTALSTSLPTDDPHRDLASVGAGLRYTMGKNMTLRIDYGHQVNERNLSGRNNRGHVGLQLAF